MSRVRSSKEAWKALNSLFSDPATHQNLPDQAISTIETYVAKRHSEEEYDAQTIQEELLSIHSTFVALDTEKRPLFLQLLQLLRPCIESQDLLEEWWTKVIEPIVNGIGFKKIEIQRASDFLISVLDYDTEKIDQEEGSRISSHFVDIVLSAWLKRTRVPSPEQETLTIEDRHVAHHLETVLVGFGKKKPKVRGSCHS